MFKVLLQSEPRCLLLVNMSLKLLFCVVVSHMGPGQKGQSHVVFVTAKVCLSLNNAATSPNFPLYSS